MHADSGPVTGYRARSRRKRTHSEESSVKKGSASQRVVEVEDERKRTRLRKSLQLYLCRTLKKMPPMHIPSSAIPANITGARFLSTCRFPRTVSVDMDGDRAVTVAAGADENSKDQAATLSDVDRFLFDNFRSLCIHDDDDNNHLCFRSSPGTSTSLVDETQPTGKTSSSSESVAEDIKEARPAEESGDNTAIVVFSMDPYADFRRSMQNMIKMHHGRISQPLDWDFLEELLFYYLQLNDQAVHKHILKAFADLTAGAHQKGSSAPRKAQWAHKSVRSRKH
ncbi:transcription repressor OFP14 [Panicum miliaceum]|uniref:Transcription repressor n=1 Tax=Panicum miliaceum TaxID=4540 RepID=A0A3L6R318_PANMI|nr:transcription repressor OFP14 [Panicum miliaceum]